MVRKYLARPYIFLALLPVIFFLSATAANAQQNYPNEFAISSYHVEAKAFLVASSNCLPYSRGCLGVIDAPFVASYAPLNTILSDVHFNRGFSAYFPFTPCLLRLPYPSTNREKTEINIRLSGNPQSPLYSGTSLIQLYPAALLSPNCDISRVNWQELIEADVPRIANPLATHILFGKFLPEAPGDITAVYGYSSIYRSCTRFHEGLDTVWYTDPTANIIYTPIPLSPIIVRGGWAMGISPACLEPAMMRADEESILLFEEAMRKLENGELRGECDGAILWGGFHVVSEFPDAITGKAAILMAVRENRGKTPWEIGLVLPAGRAFALCATVSGYAGDFSPHCHYQAAIIPGSIARELIRGIRETPSEYIRSPNDLIHLRNSDWGGFWSLVYRYSVDPAIFLLPEETARCLNSDDFAVCWKNHAWPEKWRNNAGVLSPCAFWYTEGQAEYIPGIRSPSGAIEQLMGESCKIVNKEIPGCFCYPPNQNYYNATVEHSRQKVFETSRMIEGVLRRFVCAKLLRCQ